MNKVYGLLAERMARSLHRAKEQGGWGDPCRAQFRVVGCSCDAQVSHLLAVMDEDRLRAEQEWTVRRTLAAVRVLLPDHALQAVYREVRLGPIQAVQEDSNQESHQARPNQKAHQEHQDDSPIHALEGTPNPTDSGPFGRPR